MAWTDPKTWIANVALSAAELNQHLRDNLKAIGDPWQSYTPSWTSSGTNPSIGNGSIVGAYSQAGKLVNFRAQVTIGTTTTFGTGVYFLTTPVAVLPFRWMFTGAVRDTSPLVTYAALGECTSGQSIALRVMPSTAGNSLTAMGQGTPITLASGDSFVISGSYEAA